MKYYLHDSNSFQDEKITKLYMKFGYEGLGLFYTLLEKLAAQEKPISNEVLKKQLNIGKRLEKVWNFMHEIGIISSKNGETFSENLLNFSEKYKIKKEKTRKKVKEWRDRQRNGKNVTDYVPVSNPLKVKESKVKESKVKKSIKEKLAFYSEQINLNKEEGLSEKYIAFVSYLFGENAIGCPIEHILKLQKQLEFDEYKKLFKAAYSKNLKLMTMLDSWLNTPKYSKDKVSIYLTLNSWINNDEGKPLHPVYEKKRNNAIKTGETHSMLELITKMANK